MNVASPSDPYNAEARVSTLGLWQYRPGERFEYPRCAGVSTDDQVSIFIH